MLHCGVKVHTTALATFRMFLMTLQTSTSFIRLRKDPLKVVRIVDWWPCWYLWRVFCQISANKALWAPSSTAKHSFSWAISSVDLIEIVITKISMVAPQIRELFMDAQLRKRRKRPSTCQHSNPRPFDYEVCALPLSLILEQVIML